MALLDRAINWLEPALPPPRRQSTSLEPTELNTSIPNRVKQQFLTCAGPPQPLATGNAERAVLETAREQRRQGRHSAVALLGAFGAGKSMLLHRIKLSLSDVSLIHHRFTSRILGESQLLNQLADSLELPPPRDINDLAAHLQAGPRRAILLDDCHLLFLRRPGGFVPLDLLLRLVHATDRHVLWIATWNVYSWKYLEYVRSLSDHFATVHPISAHTPSELQRLLLDSANRSGLQVTWPADQTDAIFRAIWAGARGRPALAQHIFLHSLYPLRGGKFGLHDEAIYRPPHQCQVKDGEEAFALGNLIWHGALTARELASINHISEAHATAILARTTANGLTVSLEPDYRLNPMYADAVIAYLDSRRAISFREVEAS